MKTETKVDVVNGVMITLTPEQLTEINNQLKKNIPITERIKNFQDIVNEFGKGMDYFENPELSIRERGLRKCEAICSVLNEGWEADYSNDDQKKWFPVFQYKSGSSSLVFSYSLYEYWSASTYGGSRLCRLKSKELSDFAGKMFQKEFLEMIG